MAYVRSFILYFFILLQCHLKNNVTFMAGFSQQCEEIWNTYLFYIPLLQCTLYVIVSWHNWGSWIPKELSDRCSRSVNSHSPLWLHQKYNIRNMREEAASALGGGESMAPNNYMGSWRSWQQPRAEGPPFSEGGSLLRLHCFKGWSLFLSRKIQRFMLGKKSKVQL